jgi:hypothetical protein
MKFKYTFLTKIVTLIYNNSETEFTREWRRREAILQRRMRLLGLREKHEIAADGNCQFASVCSQLFNDPSEHPKLRRVGPYSIQ